MRQGGSESEGVKELVREGERVEPSEVPTKFEKYDLNNETCILEASKCRGIMMEMERERGKVRKDHLYL